MDWQFCRITDRTKGFIGNRFNRKFSIRVSFVLPTRTLYIRLTKTQWKKGFLSVKIYKSINYVPQCHTACFCACAGTCSIDFLKMNLPVFRRTDGMWSWDKWRRSYMHIMFIWSWDRILHTVKEWLYIDLFSVWYTWMILTQTIINKSNITRKWTRSHICIPSYLLNKTVRVLFSLNHLYHSISTNQNKTRHFTVTSVTQLTSLFRRSPYSHQSLPVQCDRPLRAQSLVSDWSRGGWTRCHSLNRDCSRWQRLPSPLPGWVTGLWYAVLPRRRCAWVGRRCRWCARWRGWCRALCRSRRCARGRGWGGGTRGPRCERQSHALGGVSEWVSEWVSECECAWVSECVWV